MPARILVWLLAACALVSCSRSDASNPDEHSREPDKTSPDEEAPPDGVDIEGRAFPLLVWAAHEVEIGYFDPSRIDAKQQLRSAVRALGVHTPEFFAEVDEDAAVLRVRVRSSTSEFSFADVEDLATAADRLEEILEYTRETLELSTEATHELEYAAINGLVAPLDPNTRLLTPEQHADLGVRTGGQFGGIGAQIRAEGRRIVVVRALPGMPAAEAGVLAGDILLKIGRESTVNMRAAEAQQLLRGPAGSIVALKVRRGKKSLSIDVTRDLIKVESVRGTLLPDGVAYLQITNFQENTAEQTELKLRELGLLDGKVKAVLMDLRGNSGGLLTQATEIVDNLVEQGELLVFHSALGREADPANPEQLVPATAPVVVLVDEGSASAAEIVGGGVQALGRGVVLGRTTFGKGSIQMVKPFKPYGRELALKLTVAEYRVAGDRKIQSVGVVPDLELAPVELTPIPGVVRYYDEERFERERERSKARHQPSAKHDLHQEMPRPPARLRYLWGEAPPEVAEGEKPPRELLDPEIRIAHEVALDLLGQSGRETQLKALEGTASRLRVEEDARIVTALGHGDVDWSVAAAGSSRPALEVTARLHGDGTIVAGHPFVLRVEVANKGSAPAHRVHIITDCVHDELDGIEMLVGQIGPGESIYKDVKLQVFPWHTDFTDKVSLQVHVGEPDAEPEALTEVTFAAKGALRPALSYEYWLVDEAKLAQDAPKRASSEPLPGEPVFSVSGNGDGVLQPGERVLLAFVARNDGPGASPDVRAVLRNLTGSQGLLEEGATPLGALAPGQVTAGAFGITINDKIDPAVPFEVELVVGDATLRTSAGDKLRFRIQPTGSDYSPKREGLTVTGEPVRLYTGAHSSAAIFGVIPEGSTVPIEGTFGAWGVIDTGQLGRRLFIPSDHAGLERGAPPRRYKEDSVRRRPAVLPPTLALEDYPRITSASNVTIRGTASHPQRVRDVMLLVQPPGIGQIRRKVHYQATSGDEATTLPFEAKIDLEPGGNRVTVLARDEQKVQHRLDIWVYRDAGED